MATHDDIGAWLRDLGLAQYADAFRANDVDRALLHTLEDADLRELGVASLGHRKRLLSAIAAAASAKRDAAATVPLRDSARPRMPEPSGTVALVAALAQRGYTLGAQLGRGGMGDVYLARQTSVGRDVAIKILRATAGVDSPMRRFAREARAIGALEHPHVVRIFDLVEGDDGSAAIVMEYVRGDTLHDLLVREGRLPFTRIAPILLRVADALGEAHDRGIVHRDLKPANVLLASHAGYADFPRVVDFGLARVSTPDESSLTRTGMIFGTPRYLSPEQVLGHAVEPRSDLYPLGVMLYEALAGRPPFGADIEAALLLKHVKEVAPPLPDDVERPPALDSLLASLLAKSPALRPPSAHALRRELETMLGQERARPRHSVSPPSSPAIAERRPVVVVCADVGPAPHDDREPTARAWSHLSQLHEAVVKQGGFVSACDGVCVLAVLGAPSAHRDDPDRAVRVALEIAALAAAPVRVAIADGEAIAGRAPGGGYLVTGAPVEEAQRLCERTEPGQIRGSASVALRTDERYDWRPDDEAHLLLGRRRSTDDSLQAPFVGRAREEAMLLGMLDGCARGGAGRVVLLVGEAGIGKSALLARLDAQAIARGAHTAVAQVHDVDVGAARDVAHQIADELLDLPPLGTPGRERAIEERIASDSMRPEQWPFLYHFLGVELPGPMQRVYDAMEPAARQAGYREMLASLLASHARVQPLLVIVEDVHWADAPTLDSIEALCGCAETVPMLLVLSSRIEGEERWRHRLVGHRVERVELGALGPEDAERLARALGADDSQANALIARAGGHPLFLAELLRTRVGTAELPRSVQGLVQMRLDALHEVDRAAIQVASVLGLWVNLDELRGVLGDLRYRPAALTEQRLLVRVDDGAYAFTHALARDAVYASLLDARRRELHLAVAERVAADRPRAAMHLERAGSPMAAAAYLEAAAAERAAHRMAYAAHLLGRARDCASDEATRVAVLGELGDVTLQLGDATTALESYRECARLAREDSVVLEALVGEASALRVLSRPREALEALDRADAIASRAGLAAGRIGYLRGSVLFGAGQLAASREAHQHALEVAEAMSDRELAAQALSGIADAQYGQGRMASAVAAYEQCLALCRRDGLLGVEVVSAPMLGVALVFLGQPGRARQIGVSSVEMARALSHRRAEALGLATLCCADLYDGDALAARDHAEQVLEVTQLLGGALYQQSAHYFLARALLMLGDRALARATAERGIELARGSSMGFVAAALFGVRAASEDDSYLARALIEEGEAVVDAGALAFGALWFHEAAIEAALALRDAALVRRLASRLENMTRAEAVPWAEVLMVRARALASVLERPMGDVGARAEIVAALDVARAHSFESAASSLSIALRLAGSASVLDTREEPR